MSSNDSCRVAKTCPLTDNGSIKLTADVIPDPGYVIKGSAFCNGIKVFINVCKKESIGNPSPAKQIARGGRSGLSWTVPHALTEQVVSKQPYRVFDFHVHPDTCRMAKTNNRFKTMLNELAVGAVAREFDVHLNARKLQFPKIKYKGVQSAVCKKGTKVTQNSSDTTAEVADNLEALNCSEPHHAKLSVDNCKSEIPDSEIEKPYTVVGDDAAVDPNNNNFTMPKYNVTVKVNRELPVINGSTFSQILVVNIELPLVSCASAINLDVFEKSLKLTSSGAVRYKLEIDLPCVIDENHSFAKFLKSRKVLYVTLPILSSLTPCISSAESSSAGSSGIMLVSESDVNVEYSLTDSATSAEIAPVQKADVIISAKDEHDANESVHCYTNIDNDAPQFFQSQDFETVSFIFTIDGVVPSSVSVSFISDVCCKIDMAKGVVDGSELSHVCCFLKFEDDCKCKDEGFTVDATDDKVVLIIAKASHCHHMWNTFWTGPDINHLQVRHTVCVMIL